MTNEQVAPNQSLIDAHENARELITYLAATGSLPDEVATGNFFKILEKARTNSFSPGEEQTFWNGYSKLAKHAHPTQVEALRFRSYVQGRRQVDASIEREYENNLRSIKQIRLYSIISFVFTLVLLTYISLTTSYMSSNQSLLQEYRSIDSGNFTGTRLASLAERQRKSAVTFGNLAGSEDEEDGANGQGFGTSDLEIDPVLAFQKTNALEEIINHLEYNLRAMQFFQFYTAAEFKESDNETNNSTSQSYYEGIGKRAKIEAHQGLINLLISSYFLPVFTSLLGVTVFILRRTSSSLNSGQYRLYESSTYSYRLTLGVVGGIVISWFTTTDASGVISSLTPAALAFVVGYSIEILYNLLDSLVKALGGNEA